MEDLTRAVVWALLLVAVWLAAPPMVAARKGYAAGPWFCALGLVGVSVLAALPRIHREMPLAERARLRSQADRIGFGLSAAGLVAWFGLCLVAIVTSDRPGR